MPKSRVRRSPGLTAAPVARACGMLPRSPAATIVSKLIASAPASRARCSSSAAMSRSRMPVSIHGSRPSYSEQVSAAARRIRSVSSRSFTARSCATAPSRGRKKPEGPPALRTADRMAASAATVVCPRSNPHTCEPLFTAKAQASLRAEAFAMRTEAPTTSCRACAV